MTQDILFALAHSAARGSNPTASFASRPSAIIQLDFEILLKNAYLYGIIKKSEVSNMVELSKASPAKNYFDDIVKQVSGVKIRSISSLSPSYHSHLGYRKYSDRNPVYIVFENGQCLIIDYLYVDALRVDFHPLTDKEKIDLENRFIKDCFNCSLDIHGWVKNDNGKHALGDIVRTEIIVLEYDSISAIELRPVTKEYLKWIDGDIGYVSPSDETFDQIKFILSNGNTFVVCADDADANGYVMVWSTEAKETTITNNQ